MNKQEIFDKVATHLLTQNAQCLVNEGDEEEMCRYFDPATGRKCAVGALIEPQFYKDEFEGVGIGALVPDGFALPPRIEALASALNASGVPTDKETVQMLQSLQHMHDTESVAEWPERLQEIAGKHNLTFNHPTETN